MNSLLLLLLSPVFHLLLTPDLIGNDTSFIYSYTLRTRHGNTRESIRRSEECPHQTAWNRRVKAEHEEQKLSSSAFLTLKQLLRNKGKVPSKSCRHDSTHRDDWQVSAPYSFYTPCSPTCTHHSSTGSQFTDTILSGPTLYYFTLLHTTPMLSAANAGIGGRGDSRKRTFCEELSACASAQLRQSFPSSRAELKEVISAFSHSRLQTWPSLPDVLWQPAVNGHMGA